ncbi:MAG: hypothetical protein R2683_02960 [Bifidobacterium adolescentis]
MEEIQGDRAGGAVAAAREPNRQHNRACSRNSTARDPPEGACVGIESGFILSTPLYFPFSRQAGFITSLRCFLIVESACFIPSFRAPALYGNKNGYFVILERK